MTRVRLSLASALSVRMLKSVRVKGHQRHLKSGKAVPVREHGRLGDPQGPDQAPRVKRPKSGTRWKRKGRTGDDPSDIGTIAVYHAREAGVASHFGYLVMVTLDSGGGDGNFTVAEFLDDYEPVT